MRLHERYPKAEAFFQVIRNERGLMEVRVSRYQEDDTATRYLTRLEVGEFFREATVNNRFVRDTDFDDEPYPFGIWESTR